MRMITARRAGQGGERRDLAERIERVTEIPMLLLALAYVAAFLVGYLPDASDRARSIAAFAEDIIIALFAAELLIRVAVAERRLAYLRRHWLDVLIVVVPFIRPLRLLRIVRVLPVLARVTVGLRRVMGSYRGTYVLLIALAAIVTSALLVTAFERNGGGSIKDFDDALWWSVTTITTVGYGDTFPVTSEGRAVAVFLMIVGIALYGTITAGVAAYFVEGAGQGEAGVTTRDLMQKLDALETRLDEQNRVLQSLLQRDRTED
jgi:voltage-gated potassium channel